MGRGGPAEPEVAEPGSVSVEGLLALLAEGRHAASDYLEDALTCALKMAGLTDAKVVGYDRGGEGYRGSIYAGAPRIPSEINVKVDVPALSGLAGVSGSGFMYLWQPGVQR